MTRVASSPSRIAPEVLISARDREAARRFVEGRGRWQLADDTLRPQELEAHEASPAPEWELPELEGEVVFEWELDAWPLAPGD